MKRFTNDDWGAFVPSDRRRALADGREIPRESEGSLLRADPGFNELLEEYSQGNGALSAEKMTRRLNAFFEVLTDAVALHGGSVVCFSGGAAVCWFDGDEGSRALGCALVLLDVLRQTSDRRERVTLAQGRLQRFLAGDPDIQSFEVTSGEILDRVDRIERLLNPGEFGLDQRMAAVAKDSQLPITLGRTGQGEPMALLGPSARPLSSDFGTPPLPANVSAEAARAFVPPEVWERLSSDEGEFAPDVRRAVVFCLRFWLPPEKRVLDELQAHVKLIQRIVHQYRGTLFHVAASEAEVSVWATFGAPVSHDDETLAALAALAEVRRHAESWKEFRVGVCQGPVYSGTYGGAHRKTYGIVGVEVALSSMIMEAAPAGSILVAAAVRRTAGDHYHFSSAEPVSWGQAAPLPVFTLGEARERKELLRLQSQGRTPILGREKDLVPFLDWFDILTQGTGGAALIEGDPGIGKSRLLAELGLQAELRGITVLQGAADSIQTTTPFLTWRPLVLELLDLEQTQTPREDELRPFLSGDPDQERLLPLLGTVLAVPVEDNEFTASLSGENRVNLTADLVVGLIRRRVTDLGKPLLLILEDLHWMDQPSWSVAAAVLKDLPQALVLFSSRVVAPGSHPWFEALVARPNLLRLKLEPLARKAALELTRVRLGVQTLHDAVERFLSSRGEGNPFYTLELAFALRDSGLMVIADGRGALSPQFPGWDALPFPNSLEGVVASRLDKLPQGAQNLMKLACVVGRRFPYSTLEGLYLQAGQGTGDLVTNLGLLAAWELVVRDPETPAPTYQFHHSVIQEVTYKHLLGTQKQALHRQVAEWYETRYAENLVPYSPVLAYHWNEANVPDKAIGYFVQAGLEALRQYANLGALAHLERALELNSVLPTSVLTDRVKGEVEVAIGEAYLQNSLIVDAIKHFELGLFWLGYPVPNKGPGLLGRILRELANQRRMRKRPSGLPGDGHQDVGLLQLVCETLITLVEAYWGDNQLDKAIFSMLVGVNLADRLGLPGSQARGYSYCSVVLDFMGFRRGAFSYNELSELALEKTPLGRDRILTLLAVGFFQSGRGEFTRAAFTFTTLGEDALRLGDHRRTRDAYQFKLYTSLFQGYFSEAMEYSRVLVSLSEEYRDENMLAVARGWYLHCSLELQSDDLSHASDKLTDDLRNPSIVGMYRMGAATLLAFSHLRCGRFDEALELAIQVTDFFDGRKSVFFSEYYLAVLPPEIFLEAAKAGGKPALALQIERSLRALERYSKSYPIGWPAYYRLRGNHELSRSRLDRAIWNWRKGLQKASELGMHLESGRLQLALAGADRIPREERLDYAIEAHQTFHSLGLAHYQEIGNSLLGGLK